MGHGKADVQVVPILRLADGADRREIPFLFIGKPRLRHQFVPAKETADVVPLAAAIDDLPAVVKFQRAADASGVAHLLHDLAIERQWLVVELVRCLNAVGRKKAVEVPLLGNRLVKLCRLLAFRLGQLQAACLPVAPAIGIGQVFGEALGKPVRVIPLAQAQQQPGAPFADGVVTQFGVVFGHHFQGACVETLGQRQPDLPGDGDFLFGREGEAPSVAVEHIQRVLRVLTG